MIQQFFEQDLGVVYSKLDRSMGIRVVGNVPAIQVYNVNEASYTPNYALTYLQLQPWMNIFDHDGMTPTGDVVIANPRWYKISGGKQTEILAGDKTFAVTADGTAANGKLTVKDNLPPGENLSLLFRGQYTDTRIGEVIDIELPYMLRCDNVAAEATVVLDAPEIVYYNPIDQPDPKTTVTARLMTGTLEVANDPKYLRFVWEVLRQGGKWTPVADQKAYPDADLDIELEVSPDTSQLTVDRSMADEKTDVRCRAVYDPFGGGTASKALTDSSPSASVTFVTKWSRINAVIHIPQRYRPGQSSVEPTAKVYYMRREVADPDSVFDIRWYFATGRSDGKVVYGSAPIAYGSNPGKISLAGINRTYGSKLCVTVSPLGGLKVWTDSDGARIVDSDGAMVLIY